MNSPRTTVVSLLARALAGPALAPVMLAQAVAPSPAGSASASGTTMAQEVIELSPFTVKTHVNHAMTKLDARDRAQLVVIAYQAGLRGPA